jgi:phage tail sheath gpL-like
MRNAILAAFPRAALVDAPTDIPGFASPLDIYNVIVSAYRDLVRLGLVENLELFAAALLVMRDPIDRNRVNIYVKPDMVNQLRVVAALVETHLELTTSGQIAA